MFKNEYQGGTVVEIFSAQGKDPVAKWKLSGGQSAINKMFDKEVKGFVYSLNGSGQTIKMQMPKHSKMSLGLVQRFLVLQVNVSQSKDFSTELVITDVGHLKRRLYLSTIHKEFSATPLHAKIPFVGLKRNVWCNMCIDLVSFTGELFKGAGFLSLDGITVTASCKLRRIFTMKTEPAGASDGKLHVCGNSPRDLIPWSCQFPPDVQQVTQVMNIERLRLADLKTGSLNADTDQSSTGRAASAVRGPRIQQDDSHIAFGSRVSRPPPLSVRKNSRASEGQAQDTRTPDGRTHQSMNMGSASARTKETTSPERQEHVDQSKIQPVSSSQKNESVHELAGKAGSLQPHPPKDRAASENAGSRKLRVHSAEKYRLAAASGPIPHLLPSPLPLQDLDSDCSEEERDSDEGSEPQLSVEKVYMFSSRPHSARRGQAQVEACWTKEAAWATDIHSQLDTRGRSGARPEDDFLASESEEEDTYTRFLCQRNSVPLGSGTPGIPPTADIPESQGTDGAALTRPQPGSSGEDQPLTSEPTLSHTEPARAPSSKAPHTDTQTYNRMVDLARLGPNRCLSPSQAARQERGHISQSQSGPGGAVGGGGVSHDRSSCRTSLSRRSLREIHARGGFRLGKVCKERRQGSHEPVWSTGTSCDLSLLDSLCLQEDEEEELRMLASLQREQEEEDEGGGATRLSASQIHHCNVSISTTSDDTSTWTHIPMPANQGHHYQKEMNPLIHSNPRGRWIRT
uniref:CFA20 domain-containing protein n=1 Tax=Esox lucius TaxID=8010 RepID=A0A3P8XDC6_ESOLU